MPSHAHRLREIDVNETDMLFSPATVRAFQTLEAMVRDKEQFDPLALIALQWIADGRQNPTPPTVVELLRIARKTEAYVQATGDTRAAAAYADIEDASLGLKNKGVTGFSLVRREPHQAR